MNFYDLKATSIDGNEIGMSEYMGKVVLVVNTASKCGFTPQFEGLENLYEKYADKGFEILGFPCNQFRDQDPGTNGEIKNFCMINYGVTFQMFGKVEVNGEGRHPVFEFLISNSPNRRGKDISWNFEKFLIDREGNVVKRFSSMKKPQKLEKDILNLL